MSDMELGRYGIALDASDGYLDDAAEAEALGYGALWLPGGQLDRLSRLTDLIAATRAVAVGAAIISLDVYAAAEVARLSAVAGPRLVIGLGGPQQPRPLAPLNRYLDELDAADPPVSRLLLAALGPRKLELAATRCAGAIPLLVTPQYTRSARSVLGSRTLVIGQLAVLDTDATRARETARESLRFLSGVAGYAAAWSRMGFSQADIAGLTDPLVDALVAWGDPATVAARAAEHLAAGADHVVLQLRHSPAQPTPIEAARSLAAVLFG
jgi:probable F420-dependent oxidoreductase